MTDPERAAADGLDWLGQFTGARFRASTPEQVKRDAILYPPAFERGSLEAMQEAVRQTLTGDRNVFVQERAGGDPFHLAVTVRSADTPDPAASERAARSQKPAGLTMDFAVTM